jgi:imidazolonepropionase-like amidohydrolase
MLPIMVDLAHHNLEQGTLSMRAAASAGVRIGLGSDAEAMTGDATALADALRAATSVAAEAVGLQEHIGTVQPGKLADLLVVDGDALAEPGLLLDPARIWLVPQLGHPVAGTVSGSVHAAG